MDTALPGLVCIVKLGFGLRKPGPLWGVESHRLENWVVRWPRGQGGPGGEVYIEARCNGMIWKCNGMITCNGPAGLWRGPKGLVPRRANFGLTVSTCELCERPDDVIDANVSLMTP